MSDTITAEQCNTNAVVREDEHYRYYAAWYPQMGGYVSKCEIAVPKLPPEERNNQCFDVRVWHDGEFPFSEDTRPGVPPARLHHCCAEQFINFGETVLKLQGLQR